VSELRANRPSARARPVADAPVAALLDRAEELSKRWAIALLGERGLDQLAEVSLQQLAGAGPGLCLPLARELQALGGGDALGVVATVEALRGVLWEATLEELRDPSARQVADLSDRLAFLCTRMLSAALADGLARERPSPQSAAAPVRRGRVLYSAPQPAPGRRGAVLIDEREDSLTPSVREGQAGPAAPEPATSLDDRPAPRARSRGEDSDSAPLAAGRPLPWDTPLRPESATPSSPGASDLPPEGGRGEDDAVLRVTRGPGARVERHS
jgi:hypothetical protein